MDGFVAGNDAYNTLEEIKKDLREMRQALVTLAEVQVQQRADRSVFDQYRADNETDKADMRRHIQAAKEEAVKKADASEHRSLTTRVNVMSGAAIALAFVIPILFQWQPWKQPRPADAALTVFATEKRQNQNPPQRLPPQEGK